MAVEKLFISKRSCEIYVLHIFQNSPAAGLEPLSGCVWPPGLKFDIPALDNANIVEYKKFNFNKYLIVFVAGFQA